jgi:hypothetical protein
MAIMGDITIEDVRVQFTVHFPDHGANTCDLTVYDLPTGNVAQAEGLSAESVMMALAMALSYEGDVPDNADTYQAWHERAESIMANLPAWARFIP